MIWYVWHLQVSFFLFLYFRSSFFESVYSGSFNDEIPLVSSIFQYSPSQTDTSNEDRSNVSIPIPCSSQFPLL